MAGVLHAALWVVGLELARAKRVDEKHDHVASRRVDRDLWLRAPTTTRTSLSEIAESLSFSNRTRTICPARRDRVNRLIGPSRTRLGTCARPDRPRSLRSSTESEAGRPDDAAAPNASVAPSGTSTNQSSAAPGLKRHRGARLPRFDLGDRNVGRRSDAPGLVLCFQDKPVHGERSRLAADGRGSRRRAA